MWFILISLLVIGLVLLIIEVVFIPGTTIVGLFGVGLCIAGVMIAYKEFGDVTGFYFLMGALASTGLALYFSFRSGAWKKFSLKSSINSKVNEGITNILSIGDEGFTLSSLRPSGKAEFKERIFEVRTTGSYIEPKTKVRITRVDAQQIIVEPINTNLI